MMPQRGKEAGERHGSAVWVRDAREAARKVPLPPLAPKCFGDSFRAQILKRERTSFWILGLFATGGFAALCGLRVHMCVFQRS